MLIKNKTIYEIAYSHFEKQDYKTAIEFFENQKLPEVNNNEKTSESKINSNEIKEADNVGNFFKINFEIAKMPSGAAIKRPANNRMLKLEELRKKIIMACSR
ncbi:hypothetical protein EOM81_03425 [bacterium]|nr:hypothetical protein [bacterium]